VSGPKTFEITCGGDTTNQQRASRHTLAIENSAGRTETNTSQGLSSDGQRQTAGVTIDRCSSLNAAITLGKSGRGHRVLEDDRQLANVQQLERQLEEARWEMMHSRSLTS